MKGVLGHNILIEYTDTEWKFIKISFALLWIRIVYYTSVNTDTMLFPSGICSWFNCSVFLTEYTHLFFLLISIALSVLYVLEKRMAITTLLMFLLCIILFTLEESNGILNRNSLYTMAFFAQFIAYYRNNIHLKEERIQFPVQIVASGYVLAAISKLSVTGIGWINEAPQVSIQIMKNYAYSYFDSGNHVVLETGYAMSSFVLQHAFLGKILFAVSLFTELFAWVAVRNKLSAYLWGVMLMGMHIGIYVFMNILIVSIFVPMFVFMINPLYLIYLPLDKLYQARYQKSKVNFNFCYLF